MRSTAARLQALIDNYAVPDVGPIPAELVALLDLPEGLGGELSIAAAAIATGLTAHTLRYYERIGLVETGRDAGGRRVYDEAALARVMFVTRLRMSDMPIRDIQQYLNLVRVGDSTVPLRLEIMQRHRDGIRSRLRELQAALAVIDYKIESYGGSAAP